MKAMVYYEYGSPDVLALQEIEVPPVREGQVRVRVRAASVNRLDWHFLTGAPTMVRLLAGLFKPRHNVLGIDGAGQVDAVGPGVTRFQPGDAVFGSADCGCFAEYACVPEEELAPKPVHLSFEEAAAVPAAARTALQGLCTHGRIQRGQAVLINGASGGVGTFAVQIAKSCGVHVTAVCSTRNLEQARSLGADRVIDYTQEDFTQSGPRAGLLCDLIFDAAGKRSFAECKRALTAQGTYVTTEFSPALALRGQWVSRMGSWKMIPLPPKRDPADLVVLNELLEAREIAPVIDRRYPLSELPQALRYLGAGHARGKVIITL